MIKYFEFFNKYFSKYWAHRHKIGLPKWILLTGAILVVLNAVLFISGVYGWLAHKYDETLGLYRPAIIGSKQTNDSAKARIIPQSKPVEKTIPGRCGIGNSGARTDPYNSPERAIVSIACKLAEKLLKNPQTDPDISRTFLILRPVNIHSEFASLMSRELSKKTKLVPASGFGLSEKIFRDELEYNKFRSSTISRITSGNFQIDYFVILDQREDQEDINKNIITAVLTSDLNGLRRAVSNRVRVQVSGYIDVNYITAVDFGWSDVNSTKTEMQKRGDAISAAHSHASSKLTKQIISTCNKTTVSRSISKETCEQISIFVGQAKMIDSIYDPRTGDAQVAVFVKIH